MTMNPSLPLAVPQGAADMADTAVAAARDATLTLQGIVDAAMTLGLKCAIMKNVRRREIPVRFARCALDG